MERKPRILCVDDQTENLKIRVLLLEQFGCEALAVPDRDSALSALQEHEVDLALIDYHLAGGATGEEIAHDVRKRWPDIKLIMLTGDAKLPESALESVDEVLIKGASGPRQLLDAIEKLLPELHLKPRREMLIPEPKRKTS